MRTCSGLRFSQLFVLKECEISTFPHFPIAPFRNDANLVSVQNFPISPCRNDGGWKVFKYLYEKITKRFRWCNGTFWLVQSVRNRGKLSTSGFFMVQKVYENCNYCHTHGRERRGRKVASAAGRKAEAGRTHTTTSQRVCCVSCILRASCVLCASCILRASCVLCASCVRVDENSHNSV